MWLLARVVTILVSATALAVVFALTNSVFGPSEGGFTFSELFLLNMRTCLVLFTAVGLLFSSNWLAMVDSFYRAGSLVFGGGHVVLPLLEREFVPTGLISEADFLAGYGATQAVPGPLFTFAAYIGAVQSGWLGGIVATLAIFTPDAR